MKQNGELTRKYYVISISENILFVNGAN